MKYKLVANQVFNQPWAILPSMYATIMDHDGAVVCDLADEVRRLCETREGRARHLIDELGRLLVDSTKYRFTISDIQPTTAGMQHHGRLIAV